MKKNLLLLFLCFPISLLVKAQDIHSSHLHSSPLILNPAMTGLVEGTGRFIANHRQQWRSVTANYRTSMFSADADFFDLDRKSSIGVGGQVIQDIAGDLDMKRTSLLASASMIRSFDSNNENIISVGVQFGWTNSSFDPNKIIAFDTEPNFLSPTTDYFDTSVGILYLKNLSSHQFVYGGLAVYHINSPIYSFFDKTDINNQIYRRYVAHGGASFNLNDRLKFMPKVIYMRQGPYQQLNSGTFISFNPNASEAHSALRTVMPGIWVRALKLENQFSVDAFVIAARANYDLFNITVSYDVNISSLSRASLGRGGPEISLVFQIGKISSNGRIEPLDLPWKKSKKFDCPDFL